jgi:hypothetical protein
MAQKYYDGFKNTKLLWMKIQEFDKLKLKVPWANPGTQGFR